VNLPATTTGHQLDTRRPDLDLVAGAWLASLTSDRTRDAYRGDLLRLVAYLDAHGVNVYAASRPVLDAWRLDMEHEGDIGDMRPLSPATIARRLSAVRSFYEYALDLGAVPVNPAARVKAPRVTSDSPTLGLDREQARAVLAEARRRDPDTAALIPLLLFGGLRVSEALALDVSDLETERGHTVARVMGKGRKRRTVPLPPPVLDALAPLLDGRTSGPVFRHEGERMARHHAYYRVGAVAEAAGVPGRITPHSLRHTCATLALDSGEGVRKVQALLGHADPKTTMRYDRARQALDGHAVYSLAAYLADA
jgi:integrase/recombinase XerD